LLYVEDEHSELLLANAVFGGVHDAPNAIRNVTDRRFRAVRRQPLFACFRGGGVDHVASEGRRLLDLLTTISAACVLTVWLT